MSFSKAFTLSSSTARIFGLDVLRAVAILAVLIEHSGHYVPESWRWYHGFVARLDGVSIFFVLSGYLIGGILIKTLERNAPSFNVLVAFWLKRWLRTLPPYYLALLVVILLSSQEPNFHLADYRRLFIFIQNLTTPHPYVFIEAWSLAIEEWFYLLIPSLTMLLCLAHLRPRYALVAVAVVCLATVTWYRYYKFAHAPSTSFEDWDMRFRKIVVTRLDSLMYGVLAAYFSIYWQGLWSRFAKPLALAGSIVLIVQYDLFKAGEHGLYHAVFSFSVVAFGTMLLLPYLSSIRHAGGGAAYFIKHTSLVSYSLYLLNLNIVNQHLVRPLLQATGVRDTAFNLVGYCCFWLFTYVLATLMYKHFEVPVMRLRKYLPDEKKEYV